MAESPRPLAEILAGTRVFLDSTIFLYHFTGVSPQCRGLLERCAAREVRALTSTLVLAEVTHRLMTIEATTRGLVAPGNVVKKLREHPDLIRQLSDYQMQVEKIPWMGIEVVALERRTLAAAGSLRSQYGLLTNDSLLAATALERGAMAFASADRDFERVEGLQLYGPTDLE
ncbi:MAG TPA: PIN domain-containing protein [Thermoanaerobaculia bacterium]|nr:PIN domain-containing protein [Thermoanaerobaculia bacterium]